MEEYKLEDYYAGNENWLNFVSLFSDEELSNFRNKRELLEYFNYDSDLTKVIYGIFKERSLNWIKKKNPLLDNLKPIDCISDENLKKRLRSLILRMPK